MNSSLLAYGLKWNPFVAELPQEALIKDAKLEHFFWRIEQLAKEGGFAVITGESGVGKSVALRMLFNHLSQLRDVSIGEITRPQSSVWDFYCELGSLFGINLKMNNRWQGYKSLREKWQHHIESTLFRPILLIDEAQEMMSHVMSELRLISSLSFDSKTVLTTVLCGDTRLPEKFRSRELIPLGSRIKVRLTLESYTKEHLITMLSKSISMAGSPSLMTPQLIETLAEHASGNPRIMMNMAHELLEIAAKQQLHQLDEKLFLQSFNIDSVQTRKLQKVV